ncbi:hypothetical protein GCM10010284_55140 [Streptomyces rubiginosohelvolus]|nr:hypothetical protein GCM10010284_55140 [Streptomyces rubiginosohelvolus]
MSSVSDTSDGPLRGSLRVGLRYVGSATGRGSGGSVRTGGFVGGEGFGAGAGGGGGGGAGGGGGGGGAGSDTTGGGGGGGGGGGEGGGRGGGGGGGGGGAGLGGGGGGGGGSGSETATQPPSPATATAETLPSCSIDATAQLSAVAGGGRAVSQRSDATAVSRAMRDPYTTGSMIDISREHAVDAGDSPDRGINRPSVFTGSARPAAFFSDFL